MRLANGPIYTRKAFPLLPTTLMCNPPDSEYAFQPLCYGMGELMPIIVLQTCSPPFLIFFSMTFFPPYVLMYFPPIKPFDSLFPFVFLLPVK